MNTQTNHSEMTHSVVEHTSVHNDHANHAQHTAHAEHNPPMDHTAHVSHAQHASAHAGHDTHAAHGGHTGHSEAMFKRPFWIALVLTIPVVLYSPMIQMLLRYTAPVFPGSEYLSPVLGSVIFWYGGWMFLTGAIGEIRSRAPGMMTLVALAITTAYAYSLAITFGIVQGMDFYWELATLVTIMLLGHWMEMRAVGSAQSALNELAKLLPDTAERIVDGQTETVAVSELQVGDLLLVRPGASIPADGVVQAGESQLNEAMITGESRPVHKHPGAAVIAGTVNGSGSRPFQSGGNMALLVSGIILASCLSPSPLCSARHPGQPILCCEVLYAHPQLPCCLPTPHPSRPYQPADLAPPADQQSHNHC